MPLAELFFIIIIFCLPFHLINSGAKENQVLKK